MEPELSSLDSCRSEQVGERAANYFGDGYHCAEAVVAAFLETIGLEAPEAIALLKIYQN
jgi:hypothetical protein